MVIDRLTDDEVLKIAKEYVNRVIPDLGYQTCQVLRRLITMAEHRAKIAECDAWTCKDPENTFVSVHVPCDLWNEIQADGNKRIDM
jgi:hypothetical protein